MVAKLLEHSNCLQWLTSLAPEQGFDIGAADEVVVQIKLEGSKIAENNMLILDR
jgi:hypothetical protein